jgi:hypothetical protein
MLLLSPVTAASVTESMNMNEHLEDLMDDEDHVQMEDSSKKRWGFSMSTSISLSTIQIMILKFV